MFDGPFTTKNAVKRMLYWFIIIITRESLVVQKSTNVMGSFLFAQI